MLAKALIKTTPELEASIARLKEERKEIDEVYPDGIHRKQYLDFITSCNKAILDLQSK